MDVAHLFALIDEANRTRSEVEQIRYDQPQQAVDPAMWEFWQGEDYKNVVGARLVDGDRVSRAYVRIAARFGLPPAEVAAALHPERQSAWSRLLARLGIPER